MFGVSSSIWIAGIFLAGEALAQGGKTADQPSFDPSILRESPGRGVWIIRPEDSLSFPVQAVGERRSEGYQVQVLATSDHLSAEAARGRLAIIFGELVLVTFDSPLYKVRIGGLDSREAAEEIRQRVIAEGYREAWIIRGRKEVGAESSIVGQQAPQ